MRGRVFAACSAVIAGAAASISATAISAAPPPQISRAELSGPELRGISGFARDGRGVFFAIPERSSRLVSFTSTRSWTTTPIHGAPFGVDLESLAWIGGDNFAIGTETISPVREGDRILLAKLDASGLHIERSIIFGYGAWSLRAAPNAGIEGLCAASGVLVAASETAGTHGPSSRRYAPVGAHELAQKRWRAFRLFLTSEKGKISALACRPARDRDRLEVVAIERHYETMRILRFELPVSGGEGRTKPVDIEPELFLDLGLLLGPRPPNFEGIEWRTSSAGAQSDELILISDNDYGGVSGNAIVLFIR